MSLVALDGTPIVAIGHANRQLVPSLAGLTSTTLDAANEACIMYGQVFTEDGASHTINTTGSSALGWRTGASTFANAGTTLKVGLAARDTGAGPPVRAVNSTDVITFDVSASFTGGGGGVTANAWQESVPTAGSKTVANGDFLCFCVQMTARAGADSVLVAAAQSIQAGLVQPVITDFTGGSYAVKNSLPNAVITFSDGALGFFYGAFVASVGTTNQTWNSGSATKEYGNVVQFTAPTKAYGIIFGANIGGDTDVVLYSDPLGTPVAEKTVAIDANAIGQATGNGLANILFPAPYSLAANTPYAVIFKPGATNITAAYKTFNASAHQKAENLGINGYAVNRASGAFAAQNSSKDRFAIGLLVGAFDAGNQPVGNSTRVASIGTY